MITKGGPMHVRPIAFLLVLGALLLATVACQQEEEPQEQAQTQEQEQEEEAAPGTETLTYVLFEDVTSLDPAVAVDSQSGLVIQNVYDRLVEVAPNGHDIEPGLAESWEVSDDGLTYTFTLHEGATFHDGSPLTAEDVVYSFQRVLAIGQGDAFVLADHVEPDGIEAADEQTVTFTLKNPYAPFPSIVALWSIGSIVNQDFIEANAAANDRWGAKYLTDHMNGTGPFAFVGWTRNQFVELERYDDYWKGLAKLARLVFETAAEPAAESLALRRGDVDILDGNLLSTDQLNEIADAEGVEIASEPIFDTIYWIFNTEVEPFDDVRVRQALSYAVDYDGIMSQVVGQSGVRLEGPLPQGLLPEGVSSPNVYERDVDQAKALLAQAGFPDGFSMRSPWVEFGPIAGIAQVLQANFADIGVEMEIREIPLGTLVEQVEAGELGFFPWSSNPDFASPDSVLYPHFHSEAPRSAEGNLAHYQNPEVDELLDLGRDSTDETESAEAYREASDVIIDEAPWVFLMQTVRNQPLRSWVTGFEVTVIGQPNFWDVNIERS